MFLHAAYLMLLCAVALVSAKERIITDLETIYGRHGVPVLYTYNETDHSSDSSGGGSVPGCPKSIDGIPWIYYGNPRHCYLAGTNGPCEPGQKLLDLQGTQFGNCVCECFTKGGEILSSITSSTSPKNRYERCQNRRSSSNAVKLGQFFDTTEKVCYNRFSQGPCKKGEILANVVDDVPLCRPTCGISESETFGYIHNYLNQDGNCVKIFSSNRSGGNNIQKNECAEDEKFSNVLQKCIPNNKFGYVG